MPIDQENRPKSPLDDLTPEQRSDFHHAFWMSRQRFGPRFDSPEAIKKAARKKETAPLMVVAVLGSALAAFVLSNLLYSGAKGVFLPMWLVFSFIACSLVASRDGA